VAFAEGNALGKGPQILRLGSDDVAWIRRRAAAGDPVFMQLEVRGRGCDQGFFYVEVDQTAGLRLRKQKTVVGGVARANCFSRARSAAAV